MLSCIRSLEQECNVFYEGTGSWRATTQLNEIAGSLNANAKKFQLG